jgi:hypothetical protein
MTQDDINREESANPANWSDGEWSLYFSKRDRRLWVPTRENATSWTFNFGHRNAALWLLGFLLFQSFVMSVISFFEKSLRVTGILSFIGAVFVLPMLTVLVWLAIVKRPVATKKDRGKDG